MGRAGPDMARELDSTWIVIATARDGAHVWPALERESDCRTARRAEVHDDLLLAAIRHVLVLSKLAFIELNRVALKNGLGIER